MHSMTIYFNYSAFDKQVFSYIENSATDFSTGMSYLQNQIQLKLFFYASSVQSFQKLPLYGVTSQHDMRQIEDLRRETSFAILA